MTFRICQTILPILFMPLFLLAQDATTAKIKSVVAEQYPGYAINETEKESWCNGENLIEVEIEKEKEEMTLLFAPDGTLRYHESSIIPAGMPSAVKDTFRQACPICKDPHEVDVLTAQDGTVNLFEIEARKRWRSRTYLIDANGKLLCQE